MARLAPGNCHNCGRMLLNDREHSFFSWWGFEIGFVLLILGILVSSHILAKILIAGSGAALLAYTAIAAWERRNAVCPDCGHKLATLKDEA